MSRSVLVPGARWTLRARLPGGPCRGPSRPAPRDPDRHAARRRADHRGVGPGRSPRGARSSFIVTVQGGYALDRRHVRIDADDFDEAISQGLEAASRADDDFAVERLKDALALYRGDFLADEPYVDWALDERDRLHNLAGRALRALTKIMLARHELDAAAEYLEQLAELEPLDAETHRDLLAVWLAQGRRTEAARRYAIYRTRMLREFGEEPEFQLQDLRPASRAGR